MKKWSSIVCALGISLLTLLFAYKALGWLVALVFIPGYLGGFVFWICTSKQIAFKNIKAPYWLTLAFFVLFHKPEEKYMKFFEAVSDITGVPVPSPLSFPVIMMLIIGVVPWLLIPVLMKKRSPLSYYFAWTFFASMGITELAHFIVFPFLAEGPYDYFPGMLSTIVLVPAALWGIYKLAFQKDLTLKQTQI